MVGWKLAHTSQAGRSILDEPPENESSSQKTKNSSSRPTDRRRADLRLLPPSTMASPNPAVIPIKVSPSLLVHHPRGHDGGLRI